MPTAPQQVTLLHVNDTHSHLDALGPKGVNLEGTLGGLPKAAAIVAAEKAADLNALFVHAGDFMQGDLFFNEYRGVSELQLLKSSGLDALVLGNRDFQFKSDFLAGVLADAWPAGGGTSLIVSAGSYYRYVGRLRLLVSWVATTSHEFRASAWTVIPAFRWGVGFCSTRSTLAGAASIWTVRTR